jgi:hypothetical protein
MYLENKKQKLAPFNLFIKRLLRYGFFAIILIAFSLGIGTVGYYYYGHLSWLDSFYMSSMILTGMGPSAEMHDGAAKIFSSIYALYSGIAFLTISAVFFAPIVHRFLHKIHVDEDAS